LGFVLPSINRLKTKFYKKYYRTFRNKTQFKLLNKIDNCLLKSVSNALNSAMENIISSEESKLIEKIENLREELNQSSIQITIEDYGAGSSNIKERIGNSSECLVFTETIAEACQPSIRKKWAILLFKLIREFKPVICLELGTCVGISASYQAMALEMNKKGKIITVEGATSVANIAKQNFEELNLKRVIGKVGRFQDVLPGLLPDIKPIDFAFIDGHHNEQATLNYFENIFPFLSENAILLFDDIGWSKGMRNAWSTLEKDDRIKYTIDLWSMGVCIIADNDNDKKKFKILFN